MIEPWPFEIEQRKTERAAMFAGGSFYWGQNAMQYKAVFIKDQKRTWQTADTRQEALQKLRIVLKRRGYLKRFSIKFKWWLFGIGLFHDEKRQSVWVAPFPFICIRIGIY